jgi:hypothetical protein
MLVWKLSRRLPQNEASAGGATGAGAAPAILLARTKTRFL